MNKKLQRIYWKYSGINHIEQNVPLSTIFPHPIGIIIGGHVKIGEKCRISQGVTIGRKSITEYEQPTIGNNVKIYTNAIILGNVTLGNNSIIGAGSIILKNVKPNQTIIGVHK
jgi:serine O-acetyltransferase